MKIKVDDSLCTGCGLCVDNCPEAFAMSDATAKIIVETIPAELEEKVREAAENCPVDAITIE